MRLKFYTNVNTNTNTDVNRQQTVINPLEVEYEDEIETDFNLDWVMSLKTNDIKDVRLPHD